MALLYIGALDDLYPLQRFSHLVRTFLYVYERPLGDHFRPGQPGYDVSSSEDVLARHIVQVMTSLECFASHRRLRPLQHEFTTAGGQRLLYFMGTRDRDMAGVVELAREIPEVALL